MRVERADFDDLVTLVTQAPTVGEGAAARDPHPPARDRRGEAGRAGADPRALDVAARARDAQGAGPARLGGVSGGEAPARRARELARPPARGERREAREGRARASRCRSAPRCSPRRRATRRARRSSSTRRASELGTIQEVALALAENLPAPKQRLEQAAGAAGARRSAHRAAALRREGRSAGRSRTATPARAEAAEQAGARAAESTGSRLPRATDRRGSLARTPGRPAPSPRVLFLVALAEEARQLGGEALAGRELFGRFHHVDAALELLDVRGRLGVGRDRLAHLLAVLLRRLLELGDVDVDAASARRSAGTSASAARGLGASET